VLFAGSNDGMLHAFRDSLGATPTTDGQEIFAYVPRTVYGNLDKLANKDYGVTATLPHQYFVDGPLAEADAYVKAPGATSASWRNYLMGTLGAGGRAVFALDVTDTANLNASSVRWELSSADDSDIGYVLSNVRIGVLPNGRWVAVFGNGFGSTSGKAVLFVVDLEDMASNDATVRAAAIHKTVLDTTGSNGLGGVTLIHDEATGRTMTIYAGDLKGKMWKLNYNIPIGVPVPNGPWFEADGGAAFFTATDSGGLAQPITSSPAVFKGPKTNGWQIVFGTGKLFSTADGSDASPQTIYSVWDRKAGTNPLTETVPRPMTRTDLLGRTLSSFAGTGTSTGTTFYSIAGTTVDYTSTKRGWYIDLHATIPGGRVVYPTQVLGYQTVFLSSVAPVQGTPLACESSAGVGLNLILPVDTGTSSPSGKTFDTNGDGVVDSADTSASAYGAKADGGDVSVSSQGSNGGNPLADVGGGGPVGDCTGNGCAKNKCVPSSFCGAKKCLVVIESAAGAIKTCRNEFPDGSRVWRRIINPPIK
jgi:type IV pilus assembly protein PilY1